jgi:hypothetical protein
MHPDLHCPRCEEPLEPGHMIDRTYGGNLQPQWQPGTPVRSFWSGLKINDRELVPVVAYRCVGCGYLELYARPQPKDGV